MVYAPLLILGIAAGARNAYALAMDTIRMDEKRRKKEQEEQIQEVLRKAKDEKNHRQD
jgi:ATP synthase protein I